MNNKIIAKRRTWFFLLAFCLSAGFIALTKGQNRSTLRALPSTKDSLPPKSADKRNPNLTRRYDLDRINLNLDTHLSEIDNQLKQLDVQLDLLHDQKINLDINFDRDKIDNQLKQLDVQLDLLHDQNINLDINLDMQLDEISNPLKQLDLQLDQPKQPFRLYLDFIKALEKDGIIAKDKRTKIEIRNGELYINNEKQPARITEKYKNSEKFNNLFDKKNNLKLRRDRDEREDEDEFI